MPQRPGVITQQATASSTPVLRAAQYVRMSTDHQSYSPVNQSDANENYAKTRGITIVVTYYDPGISGLHIEGRDALRQLIEDVQSKNRLFMPRARTFASPREIRQRRSNYALLQGLRRLLQKHGRLSRDIINNGGIAGSGAYVRRFGSLTAAYSLIGYAPDWLHGRRARRSILFD